LRLIQRGATASGWHTDPEHAQREYDARIIGIINGIKVRVEEDKAHRQLMEMDQARAALDRGHEIVRLKLPRLESKNVGPDWMNVLMTYTLMSEADRTVGSIGSSEPR
jgi:hypothetical protein